MAEMVTMKGPPGQINVPANRVKELEARGYRRLSKNEIVPNKHGAREKLREQKAAEAKSKSPRVSDEGE